MSAKWWTRACASLAAAFCSLAVPASGSAQDGAAIQERIDAAGEGGVVDLDSGNYPLTQPLTFRSRVTLNGPLEGKAVLNATGLPAPLTISLDRLDGVLLRRLEFRKRIGAHPQERCAPLLQGGRR